MTNKVTVSWPNRVLSPNVRAHWAVKSKAAKLYRDLACIACKMSDIKAPETEKIHLFVDFYAPDKRHRDSDNLLSSCKSAIDGIADALWVNDRRFIFHPYLMDEVVKGGKVVFTITSNPEEKMIDSQYFESDGILQFPCKQKKLVVIERLKKHSAEVKSEQSGTFSSEELQQLSQDIDYAVSVLEKFTHRG